jgi:hypothetical protein
MTKRYLESLPTEEQDAILGEIDPDYEEWLSQLDSDDPAKVNPDYEAWLADRDSEEAVN